MCINGSSNSYHLNAARIGRLRMLRGLPLSKVLGLWSGHSCRSPSGSSPPGSSCSWVSSCSSSPTLFSYEPVWCMCAHERSAVMLEVQCLCKSNHDDHDMVHRWSKKLFMQGSQRHPRTHIQILKHLLHSLLLVIIINQQAIRMLQRYTKHYLFYLSYA